MKTSPFLRYALAALVAAGASAAVQAADCIGNCGESVVNGTDVVGFLPSGSATYNWVSTSMGQVGAGQLAGFEGTNGSSLTSDAFFATAGSKVEFYFNYVTSDGAGYADYAWSQLIGASSSTTLFTARTQPTGSIAPGFGLPGVTATLSPAEVAIIPGAPTWAPLGVSSGSCFSAGCGYTGWIKSTYEIQATGTYQLAFGVTNSLDDAYDSGLAFQGLLLNGSVIGDGSAADKPLLPSSIGPGGAFVFEFTPTLNVPVFIDPIISIGYDYEILGGDNLITSVLLPTLSGDLDGYEIYALGDTSAAGLLGTVKGGESFLFTAGVKGFSLRDIDEAAMLDPANPTAFVTGLTFANDDAVTISQTPVTAAVPEPETWAMLLAGLAVTGVIARRRQA
jgi:hypothetical protein